MKTQNYKNIENASLKKQNKNATMKRGDNKWLTERRPNANCTWILQRLKITKIQKSSMKRCHQRWRQHRALHCLHSLYCYIVLHCMYALIYWQGRLERYWNVLMSFWAKCWVSGVAKMDGYPSDCYDYQSTILPYNLMKIR